MQIKRGKKLMVGAGLLCFMALGIAATRLPAPPDERPKNLKVLSKKISDKELDEIMDGFKAALGVKCNFCHAANKDTSVHKLDFPSDEKPEKEIARHMMRMTAKINKKYFSFAKDDKGDVVQPVQCYTCHRGKSHPGDN
jgi:hypothetical protein